MCLTKKGLTRYMADITRLLSAAEKILPASRLILNAVMAEHTSFKIGGKADILAFPEDEWELKALLREAYDINLPVTIIGGGSNLLVSDDGIEGLVIKTKDGFSEIIEQGGDYITAQSGISLSRLAVFAAQNGLGGLEFAHGIPGTLGGAICMNAGAYGGEMKDIVQKTWYLDENLKICELEGEDHDFSYRHSFFSDNEKNIILRCLMRLTPGNPEEIKDKMAGLMSRRKASQPLEYPSAGSAFKRPQGGYAAELIQRCGLKGYKIGGAEVSLKHSGFIINSGGASCRDVLDLIDYIKKTVYEQTEILLQPEIKITGRF